jgi:hypothetical protein
VFDSSTEVTGNITVYARWKPIVTFDPNGGNWSGSTTPITVEVVMNTTVSAPSDPERATITTGGLYAGTIEGDTINSTLNGWRRDGDSANWNFSTPITAPVTLKAHWAGGPQPINLTSTAGDNILAKTLTYIRANSGTYTLLLGEDVNYAYNSAHQINNAAINLTVRGFTSNRTITLTNNGNIFYIAAGSLTLGDNITLMGRNNNASLVYLSSSNSRFTMSGGTISGNTSSQNYSGGGVNVDGGTFTKTGGGPIYGYTAGDDDNSNKVVNASGVILNNRGHAVYVNSGSKRRETTAGPAVNLDSSVSGTAGGWE